MKRTVFSVPKMDCPSEERMIRMVLQGSNSVQTLDFDLNGRKLTIMHRGAAEPILSKLEPLGFGAKIAESRDASDSELESVREIVAELEKDPSEAKVLKALLAINGTMFVLEIILGWVAQSTGLIADSLDMFADAAVYGVSLYAVGKAFSVQRKAARMSGYMQLLLALGAFSEVVRRFIHGSEPFAPIMVGVSCLALIANVTCLVLISKHRGGGVHMKASWVFSTNDVIANMGVFLAGGLVYFFNSSIPDLVIGTIIAFVVLRGSITILKISKPQAT